MTSMVLVEFHVSVIASSTLLMFTRTLNMENEAE
jgi:hypothetical protein